MVFISLRGPKEIAMNMRHSFRRIIPVVAPAVVLVLLGFAARAAAASDRFEVKGSFLITSVQGSNTTVDVSGQASPGGSFTGSFSGKQFKNGDVRGTVTLDFGGGNTLTYFQDLVNDPATGQIDGTYVITGGTGRYAGATGSGRTTIFPAGNGVGTFTVSGTLSN
jgi:hypothetical protein